MHVDTAKMTDLSAIFELDRIVLGNDSRQEFLQKAVQEGQCYVAWQEGQAAGFAVLVTHFFGQGFLELVIVHPNARRQGVATALIRHVETVCPTEKLFTSTNESNHKMQQLCEKLSYVRSGSIENLDEGDPEIVYFKKMRSS